MFQTSIRLEDVTINPEYEAMVPPLTDEEYQRLKESIAEVGLYEKIIVNPELVILDGHHRFKACREKGVMPRFEVKRFDSKVDEEIYVIESNVIRRQLTDYNKTILAMKLEPMYAAKAKQRQEATQLKGRDREGKPVFGGVQMNLTEKEKGQARDQAAKAVGLSPATYHRGKVILNKANEKELEDFKKGIKKAYTIYKNIETREKIEKLENEVKNLPPIIGEYDVVVVDPPWDMEVLDQGSWRGGVDYPRMTVDEIKNIKIPAKENCILWLWTTNTYLHEAFHVLEHWGFEYKSCLTWAKDKMGVGVWLRGQTEHCLLATKGKPVWDLKGQTTLLLAPTRGHSIKPDEFYDLVDSLCYGCKLDYFAREPREGWITYGTMERTK